MSAIAKTKVLILFSGGMDSTACIHYYKQKNYEIETLFVDFGQPSNEKELHAIKSICNLYKVAHTIIKVDGIGPVKDGFIPGRNIFLISTALLSDKVRYGMISLGIHSGTTYLDCSSHFLNSASHIINMYTHGAVSLDIPFTNWNKHDIFNYCNLYDVPIGLTYSCELGLEQPCNNCTSCKDLKKLYASKNEHS